MTPLTISDGTLPHLLVMLGLSVALWALLFFRSRVGRLEGIALVAVYLLYVGYLFT